MSDRKRKEEPIPAPPKEVLLATAKNKYTSLITIRWVAMTLSVGLVLLAATPLANAIAGTETNFTVNISLAATATLAVTTAAGYGYGARQRRRANQSTERNNVLNQRIENLQKELEASQKELEKLQKELEAREPQKGRTRRSPGQ
jgi:hypothetical protein